MTDKSGTIIPIDKPVGWTSFQVVNKIKWHLKRTFGLKKFKIGHAGTLDPLASGLLLVCVGAATRQIELLQSGTKTYTGTMVLGATTPCHDLERGVDCLYPFAHIDQEAIEEARKRFIGVLRQVPPQFSAVKVDGQRAYLNARDGNPVDIEAKEVTVYSFDVTAFRQGDATKSLPRPAPVAATTPLPQGERELYRNPRGNVPEGLPQLDFRVTCGKGTYIRSIARDMGACLNSGAFLSALRREQIGDYKVSDALPVQQIESLITAQCPDLAWMAQRSQ